MGENMKLEALKAQAKQHDIKVGWTNKALFSQIAQKLPEDAEIEVIVTGLNENSQKVYVVVTPEKVYMISYASIVGGINTATIDRSKITGVSTSGGLLRSVSISTAGGNYVIDKANPQSAAKIESVLA